MNSFPLAREIHHVLDIPVGAHGHCNLGRKIVQIIVRSMRDALLRGEDVHIKGFGRFSVRQGKPYRTSNIIIRRHPGHQNAADRSPVTITHRAKRKVIFIPSDALMAMLNHAGTPTYDEQRIIKTWTSHESPSCTSEA